jgi:metal-responsive CopG/Arc/MetJ family transcriptional regulator
MENRKDITVNMPKSLRDQIDDQLEYGDGRAGWIREAIRMRLEAETEADGAGEEQAGTDGGHRQFAQD